MPRLGQNNLNQRAVLWDIVHDDSTGQPVYDNNGQPMVEATPVEINCAYQIGLSGDPIVHSVVMGVDQQVDVGSQLALCSLAAYLEDPVTPLYQVVDYQQVPDVKRRYFYRQIRLQRLGDLSLQQI